MTAKRAEDIELYIDVTARGDFICIGALRDASITMNAIAIDISNIESAETHEALMRMPAAKIAGQCIFNSDSSFERTHAYFTATIVMEWRVIIPYFGAIQGLFRIRSLNKAGGSASGPVAELALQLAGKPRFMIAEAVTVKA
jgi:predicted secreted protein